MLDHELIPCGCRHRDITGAGLGALSSAARERVLAEWLTLFDSPPPASGPYRGGWRNFPTTLDSHRGDFVNIFHGMPTWRRRESTQTLFADFGQQADRLLAHVEQTLADLAAAGFRSPMMRTQRGTDDALYILDNQTKRLVGAAVDAEFVQLAQALRDGTFQAQALERGQEPPPPRSGTAPTPPPAQPTTPAAPSDASPGASDITTPADGSDDLQPVQFSPASIAAGEWDWPPFSSGTAPAQYGPSPQPTLGPSPAPGGSESTPGPAAWFALAGAALLILTRRKRRGRA